MKKIVLSLLMLASFLGNAQEVEEPSGSKNEISINLLDLVVAGTLDVGYERFLGSNQSVSLDVSLFDTFGYYDVGYIDETTGVSARIAYNLYFSKKREYAGFYFFPMAKIRTGSITSDWDYYYVYDYENDVYEDYNYQEKYDINGFALGFGVGNKWVLKDTFSLDVFANISRTLGGYDDEYIDAVEFRAGVSFGYRF
ncbi:hypothetical protein SAMN05216480_108130 [Pustulibacterium marinum]|uniref:DUF3575 domain-containing protein n=1 Tax=Pustulibacterium marinum TaxID=1224947 RepID=A0A1I7HD26_9FLAO|nr:DUF3575 domain-containing protein [Pustulibacterium marinum]SFU58499.1 hypothetical protein SAMN05216480_108130 [Pustulibacterium marinum]